MVFNLTQVFLYFFCSLFFLFLLRSVFILPKLVFKHKVFSQGEDLSLYHLVFVALAGVFIPFVIVALQSMKSVDDYFLYLVPQVILILIAKESLKWIKEERE